MARLNLNVEFGYKFSEYDDWWYPEEDENENWEEHCKFRVEIGASKGFVNFPMACDKYPFKEAFRRPQQIKQGWDFGDWKKGKRVGDISIWKYVHMIIENNIGKSFNKTFTYYLKRTHHIPDYIRHYYFLKEFEERKWSSYEIDESGNIQFTERFKEKNNRTKDKTPYVFESADCVTAMLDIRTFEVLPRTMWGYTGNHKSYVTQGYQIPNVIPGSKLEKRLKWEYRQKKKQLIKYWESEKKNKEYSFLTREEEEIKKEKLQDDNELLRHGFNDESFKGDPYHGRKNKKTK
jgi:hypothetical protein